MTVMYSLFLCLFIYLILGSNSESDIHCIVTKFG